ncbi:hypothetical protein [Ottowia thiooxydans]|uniref:Uncharacterized protein n=1 Tax=Ottowia thiooxydans TaxID=219182 RepID=A0ABV2Q1T3_9BURK
MAIRNEAYPPIESITKPTVPTPQAAYYLIVAHRNGPQGVVPLQFIGKYQQMGDWMGSKPLHKAAPASLRSRSADF